MAIQQIHTFLVRPGKGGHEKTEVNGAAVPLSGNMFDLLSGIYERSEDECDIHIFFRPESEGKQRNEFRELLIDHIRNQGLDTAQLIAERLRDTTDGRSGLGLLFIISGMDGPQHKIVISRFPTDSAIFVDENQEEFTVEFLERVFMKNKTSHKAAVYRDKSFRGGFWTGRAIDKQTNSRGIQLSDYWIADFLLSDFAVTPAAGSRRLGKALRDAVRIASLEVKEELISAGRLASGLAGKPISVESFADQFGLSSAAKETLMGSLKNTRTAQQQFKLDIGEFRNYVAFRSVELDNGALLTADTADFEEIFNRRVVDKAHETIEYSTRGKIVDEKLKSQR
ncbi:MAG: hypothetical protein Tsb0032_09590 [Kiloniellaceae bacterium]